MRSKPEERSSMPTWRGLGSKAPVRPLEPAQHEDDHRASGKPALRSSIWSVMKASTPLAVACPNGVKTRSRESSSVCVAAGLAPLAWRPSSTHFAPVLHGSLADSLLDRRLCRIHLNPVASTWHSPYCTGARAAMDETPLLTQRPWSSSPLYDGMLATVAVTWCLCVAGSPDVQQRRQAQGPRADPLSTCEDGTSPTPSHNDATPGFGNLAHMHRAPPPR